MEHHLVGGWRAAERAQEEVGGAHTSGENRLGLRDACFLWPAKELVNCHPTTPGGLLQTQP